MDPELSSVTPVNGVFDPARLKVVREALGINKAEAARRLELSKMGYGRYENGQRTPSLQTIEFMAQRLSTNAAYLTGMTDDPAPDYILVSRESDPLLYELIAAIRGSASDKAERLLHYLKTLE